MTVRIADAATVLSSVIGDRIVSGKETKDGLHVEFEGGQILIFTGEFVIAVYKLDTTTVH